MTITEICDMLRSELLNNGYEYGFYSCGKKYKPNMSSGFDEEYHRLSKMMHRIQPPSVTMREKTGTCLETTLVMRALLDDRDISNKIWLLYNKVKNKPHTILTFEAEEKVVYLELTPQSAKPWYGKEICYSCEKEFLDEYRSNGYEVTDISEMLVSSMSPYSLLQKL